MEKGKRQSRTIWQPKHKPHLWPETSDLYLFSCDQLLGQIVEKYSVLGNSESGCIFFLTQIYYISHVFS